MFTFANRCRYSPRRASSFAIFLRRLERSRSLPIKRARTYTNAVASRRARSEQKMLMAVHCGRVFWPLELAYYDVSGFCGYVLQKTDSIKAFAGYVESVGPLEERKKSPSFSIFFFYSSLKRTSRSITIYICVRFDASTV